MNTAEKEEIGTDDWIQNNKKVMCKNKHAMNKLTEKPDGYRGRARCGVCYKRNIDEEDYFYNCSECEYDLCMNCSKEKVTFPIINSCK